MGFSFPAPIKSVTIDLDGTLLDTALDIAAAANAMLTELRLPLRSELEIRNFVGRGIAVTVERCLPEDRRTPAFMEAALESFKRYYAMSNGKYSDTYPGVIEGLDALKDRGIPMACVTNKAAAFAEPLLLRAGLAPYFAFTISGDTLAEKKPHPLPLLEACRRLGVAPAANLHIGDSDNDASAARAAGCPSATLPYGYNEGRDYREIQTDVIVPSVAAALALIE